MSESEREVGLKTFGKSRLDCKKKIFKNCDRSIFGYSVPSAGNSLSSSQPLSGLGGIFNSFQKSSLFSGNACYYSVLNFLSYRLLSKYLKIKIYRTIILPVVLYGCETWSLTLREERRLRVFENRMLRRVFESKRDEVTGNG